MSWRCHIGLGPETVDFSTGALQKGVGYNILRPEAVEAICMLYRITNDTIYRDWGWQIFEAFDKYSKVGSPATSFAKLQALKHDFPTSVRIPPSLISWIRGSSCPHAVSAYVLWCKKLGYLLGLMQLAT